MYSASCCSRRIGSPVEKHIVNNVETCSQEASKTNIDGRTISSDQLLVLKNLITNKMFWCGYYLVVTLMIDFFKQGIK